MQLTLSALVAALCWSYRLAAASSSHVYTIDEPATLREGRVLDGELSPEVARLVLAQRVGVEDYHGADLEDETVLRALNDHAAREGLFGEHKVENVLILAEGVDDELSLAHKSPHFTVSPSPSANATRGLFLDLARQALPNFLNDMSDDELYTLLKGNAHKHGEQQDRRIAIWSGKEIQTYVKETLRTSGRTSLSITIITTPSSHTTGDKGANYGTYTMPDNIQSPLRKREQPTEEPLEVEPSASPSEHTISPHADQSSPLPGILPACYTTLSACESTTRNCSGHGTCSKKYTDTNAPKGLKDCYACQCSATTSDSGNGGVLTTYWGGPACQKKDVSVQFWLIALFSVAMMGLVSFAVGQVWSMGDEELPSVIGAGVSGPVKRS